MGQRKPESSVHKTHGAGVAAFARRDDEGFHITLQFENLDTGTKLTRPGMIAYDEPSARQFIASEIAKYGFELGDCHIAWKRN